MIAKKKIAGMALAAALPFSNISVKAAGSAVTPLNGAYVFITKLECGGGGSGFSSLSSVGHVTFFEDTWDPEDPEIVKRNLRECPNRNSKILGENFGRRVGEPVRH
jgi:hypothetical protein